MTRPLHSNDLARVLASAAAFGTGDRQIWAHTGPEALGAVLDAIAACILPRKLTVSDETGPLIVIEAAQGRLTRLIEAGADRSPENLFNRPLHAPDLVPVAALLAGLFTGEQSLALTTAPTQTDPNVAGRGLSCPDLMAQLGLVPFDSCVSDPLAYLAEAAEDVLIAVCRGGTAPQLTHSDNALPADLVSMIDRILSGSIPMPPIRSEKEILFFSPTNHPDVALGLTSSANAPVVLVVEAASMADIAAFWANMPHVPLVADADEI